MAFDPTGRASPTARAPRCALLDATGQLLDTVSTPGAVLDLAFSSDGAVWVLLGGSVARIEAGALVCSAELAAEWILDVSPDGGLTVVTQEWLETGVWGEAVVVDRACAPSRSVLVQDAPSARISRDGRTWTGTTAVTGPGPRREGAPSVILEAPGAAPRTWTVLADGEPAGRVASLAVGAGRLWCWARTVGGAVVRRRRYASRSRARDAPRRWCPYVPNTTQVAMGRDLLDLTDGRRIPDALPAPALDVAPDGLTWVLGQEETQALWGERSAHASPPDRPTP
ncbi:MAG: hypothetical protein IPO74_10870 [Thermomonas sp.]|nr:hypothetical protein [Thermomonas sp.]